MKSFIPMQGVAFTLPEFRDMGSSAFMREAYEFAAGGYDARLAALAIVVCSLASVTAIGILAHAARTTGYMREIWLWVAAAAGGSGVWATHFIRCSPMIQASRADTISV